MTLGALYWTSFPVIVSMLAWAFLVHVSMLEHLAWSNWTASFLLNFVDNQYNQNVYIKSSCLCISIDAPFHNLIDNSSENWSSSWNVESQTNPCFNPDCQDAALWIHKETDPCSHDLHPGCHGHEWYTTQLQSEVQGGRDVGHCVPLTSWVIFLLTRWASEILTIDLIFHPTRLTVAVLTLSFGGLINVIGYKDTLPVRTGHILIVITLGVLGGNTGVFCSDIRWHASLQFGNVTKGIRSLNSIRWSSCCCCPWFGSVGTALCFCLPPEYDKTVESCTRCI